jgi:hypothetical protein
MTLKRKPGFEDRPVSAILGKSASASADSKPEYPERASRPFGLEIMDTGGELWDLSWGAYYGVNFQKVAEFGGNGEKFDRVILQYVKYEVILTGFNLRQYKKGFHDGTLEQLRVTAREYEKTLLSRGEPVIRSIQVTTLGMS